MLASALHFSRRVGFRRELPALGEDGLANVGTSVARRARRLAHHNDLRADALRQTNDLTRDDMLQATVIEGRAPVGGARNCTTKDLIGREEGLGWRHY